MTLLKGLTLVIIYQKTASQENINLHSGGEREDNAFISTKNVYKHLSYTAEIIFPFHKFPKHCWAVGWYICTHLGVLTRVDTE